MATMKNLCFVVMTLVACNASTPSHNDLAVALDLSVDLAVGEAQDFSTRDQSIDQGASDMASPSPSPTPSPTVFLRVANLLHGGVGAVIENVDVCVRPAGSSTAWTAFQPVFYSRGYVGSVPPGNVTNYVGVATGAVDVVVVSGGQPSCPAATTYHGTGTAQPGYSTVVAAINAAAGRESDFALAADETAVSPAATRLRVFNIDTNPPSSISLVIVGEPAPNTPQPVPVLINGVSFGEASPYMTLYPSPIPTPVPSPSPTPAPDYLAGRWDNVTSNDAFTLHVFSSAPASTTPYTVFSDSHICSDAPTKVETTFFAVCNTF
jgi:hypothetical protein